jgi:hypothetical protein
MKDYQLICMSFDGEFVSDFKGSLEDCREASAEMGSKWYFYPFHFILTESGKTVADAGDMLECFIGKRFKTVVKKFEELYNRLESDGDTVDCDGFICEPWNMV